MFQQVLACCVDRQELKAEGMNYIEKNMALAADVVTFIDLLILNLSGKFKINLLTIDNNTECFT